MDMILAVTTLSLGGFIPMIVTLVIVGVVLYLIQTYVPMAPPIKTVITVIVVLVMCLFLLRFAGLV